MKIYTKTGDAGETSLFDGTRVSKKDLRVTAYGEVDELQASLGVARAAGLAPDLDEMCVAMQRDLFAVGARLADPSHKIAPRVDKAMVTDEQVHRLEGWIDRLDAELPPLRHFILSGGTPAGAALHLARAVCRRAERAVLHIGADAVEPVVLVYINRVSDLLFTMARAANHRAGVHENAVVTDPVVLAASYAACERLARTHYENFPVASRLLPQAVRPHVAAVYAFARVADDVADEPGRETGERLALLNAYRQRLNQGTRRTKDSGYRLPDPAQGEFFPALFDTIDRFDLPVPLFTDLLSAFEQDVTKTRYETWSEVLDYCRRSANPVGRIVLRLSGYRDEALDRASDDVCTALQLANFWQDLAVDWGRGRLYVPEEVWLRVGATTGDLDRGAWTPAWQAALTDCGDRTRALFTRGRPACDGVSGRLRYELRATWLGGTRILDRLERAGYDVFRDRPSLGPADWATIAWRMVWWR